MTDWIERDYPAGAGFAVMRCTDAGSTEYLRNTSGNVEVFTTPADARFVATKLNEIHAKIAEML